MISQSSWVVRFSDLSSYPTGKRNKCSFNIYKERGISSLLTLFLSKCIAPAVEISSFIQIRNLGVLTTVLRIGIISLSIG